jgi:hypothetical protein
VTGTWEKYIISHWNRHEAEETVARVVVMSLGKGTRDHEREVVTMDDAA